MEQEGHELLIVAGAYVVRDLVEDPLPVLGDGEVNCVEPLASERVDLADGLEHEVKRVVRPDAVGVWDVVRCAAAKREALGPRFPWWCVPLGDAEGVEGRVAILGGSDHAPGPRPEVLMVAQLMESWGQRLWW